MSAPSGVIYLIANAVIDNTYQNTIDFKTAEEQLAFWRSNSKYALHEYSYIRKQRQYIHVDKSLEELDAINYLIFRSNDNSGRWWYCFVTDKEYVTDSSTYVYFEIDVIQTYLFDIEVKPSYVLQEHQDRWTAEHKPIYSRTDEGLEYGTEYTLESGYKVKPSNDDLIKWFIFVCADHGNLVSGETQLEQSEIANAPTPFIYYLVPLLPSTYKNRAVLGLQFNYVTSDATGTTMGRYISNFKDVQTFMLNSSFGQYIKNICHLPYNPFNFNVTDQPDADATGYPIVASETTNNGANFGYTEITEGGRTIRMLAIKSDLNTFPKELATMGLFEGIDSAMPTAEQWAEVKSKPYATERDKRFESKLLTHPYRYNLLTDWSNAPVVIKNEYMTDDKIRLMYSSVFSFNSPARYYLKGYKKDVEGRGACLMQEIHPEQPIISDAYYTYMLQNKNQIQANQTNAIISGATQVATGVVANLASGNVVGALLGGVSDAVSAGVGVQNLIRSENAKQRDIKNYPDTIISSNDCSLNLVDKNTYVCFYRYKICCEFEEQLAQYWHMYGYMCKHVKIPNLKTRTRFNYVKTIGANIVGPINQTDIALIRAVFDKGITFWHYNATNFKPLDYSYENIEVNLV